MPHLELWQWALGTLVAVLAGVAKTGVPGLGILIVPLMVLTVGDARLSAGWLLPMLCAGDLLAVAYWRRHASVSRLLHLVPWVVVGMMCGAFALRLNERTIRPLVGSIVLVMLAMHLWRRYAPRLPAEVGHAGAYGATAGFATTVANAAGPVMSLYLLGKRLPKKKFVATGAWFYFVVNLTKLPIYGWNGLLTRPGLTFDLVMLPAVVAGAMVGRKIVDLVSPGAFEILVLALTGVSTLLLFR